MASAVRSRLIWLKDVIGWCEGPTEGVMKGIGHRDAFHPKRLAVWPEISHILENHIQTTTVAHLKCIQKAWE